jgi:hypothetical protein
MLMKIHVSSLWISNAWWICMVILHLGIFAASQSDKLDNDDVMKMMHFCEY